MLPSTFCELKKLIKYLGKKDFAIIGLFFLFLLVSVPLFALFDETSLERALPLGMSILSEVGFMLSVPIRFIMMPFRSSLAVNLDLISWMTAAIYSIILASILSWFNTYKEKSKIK